MESLLWVGAAEKAKLFLPEICRIASPEQSTRSLADGAYYLVAIDLCEDPQRGLKAARAIRANDEAEGLSPRPLLLVLPDEPEPQVIADALRLGWVDLVRIPADQALLQVRLAIYAQRRGGGLEKLVAERTAELSESRAFLDSLFENIPNMVFVKDAKALRFVRFNRAGEALLGQARGNLIGKNDYDFFPAEQADFFTSKDRAVLAGREIVDIPEEPIETAIGTRILHTKKIPLFDVHGSPEYLLGISEDVTERVHAEAEKLRLIRREAAIEEQKRASARSSFLGEATTVLASSLDYLHTLQRLADFVVPSIADWCTITVNQGEGEYERVAAVHRDPAKASLFSELARYMDVNVRTSGIGRVIADGQSLFAPQVSDESIQGAAQDLRHYELMTELGTASCMVVSIRSSSGIHGAIALVRGSGSPAYDSEDLALAEELGRRAGIAIENALLYRTAQKAISARDEFLSVASHELKTPLTSLKLQIDLTRRAVHPDRGSMPTPEKLARVLDISTTQIRRLTMLVDDLLDVSRIDAGKLLFRFERLDLGVIVREAVERYFEPLGETSPSVSIVVPPEPLLCECDPFRIEQVLVNLLSNAVKYGEKAPIEVRLDSVEGGRARITVTDEGMGIPSEMIEKIFERFERATSSANISGLGLGLYISREIVREHGGTIRAEHASPRGTRFVIDLRCTQSCGA